MECPLTQHSTDHWSWYFTYKSGKVNPCARTFILEQYQTFGNKIKRRWLICRMAVCGVESWQHELESKKIQLGPEPGGRRKILLQRKRFKAAWCTAFHKLTILEFHSSPTKEVETLWWFVFGIGVFLVVLLLFLLAHGLGKSLQQLTWCYVAFSGLRSVPTLSVLGYLCFKNIFLLGNASAVNLGGKPWCRNMNS